MIDQPAGRRTQQSCGPERSEGWAVGPHTIERGGQVVGFDRGQALVQLDAEAGCGSCGSRGRCGSAGRAEQVIRMPLRAGSEIGERVTLAAPSSSIALAALAGYLLPAACLLAGAVAGSMRYGSDAAAVTGAGLGLLAGLLLARLIGQFSFRRGIESICGPNSNQGEHS